MVKKKHPGRKLCSQGSLKRVFKLVCFQPQPLSYIYTGPYKCKAFVGDGCPEISPLCLGLVPICFFFNVYGHTSGLMGCMGGSLQKGPLGLLESLLIVLCHSVFKNSLVQRLFTVSAICSGCFPEISQAPWKTSILSGEGREKNINKMFVSTWVRQGCENKHHLIMMEMWTWLVLVENNLRSLVKKLFFVL